MSLWSVGSSMIVNLAGLQDPVRELYEAAAIDGATWWHQVLEGDSAHAPPVLFFNLVIGVIGTFSTSPTPTS
jgi:multiple sugar transport system permease protein